MKKTNEKYEDAPLGINSKIFEADFILVGLKLNLREKSSDVQGSHFHRQILGWFQTSEGSGEI